MMCLFKAGACLLAVGTTTGAQREKTSFLTRMQFMAVSQILHD